HISFPCCPTDEKPTAAGCQRIFTRGLPDFYGDFAMVTYDPSESHDQNFKNIIVENPWEAITFAMPKCINFFQQESEIIAIREETLKTFFAESFMRTDVPLLVRYDDVAFTFLIEHQHDPDAFSIHHLARYVSFLEEQHKRDVVPIVYFPAPKQIS
ncbi:MAG: hypothetical protein ACREBU_22780, partial [Nitrososphaera sp.]